MQELITKKIFNTIQKHVNDRHFDGMDMHDMQSFAMLSAVKRAKKYNGINEFAPYLVHYVKKDVTDYIRLRRGRHGRRNEKRLNHSKYSVQRKAVDMPEDFEPRLYDHHVDQELIDWVDSEAGFPLATWLSEGYQVQEVAEMRGVTSGCISQMRRRLYDRARALQKI